jgi:hypothetical protein
MVADNSEGATLTKTSYSAKGPVSCGQKLSEMKVPDLLNKSNKAQPGKDVERPDEMMKFWM